MTIDEVLSALHKAETAGDKEAARHLAELAQDFYREEPAALAVPEPKPTGFFSGLKTGFEEGAGSATSGLGELTGLEGLKTYGESLKEAAKKREGDTSYTGKIGQTFGSIAGRYGAPIVAGGAAALAAPEIGVASALGFAATNLPLNIGETLRAQKEAGQERNMPAALAVGIGKTAIDSLGGALLSGPMRSVFGKTAMEQADALVPDVLAGKLTAEEASQQVSGFLKNFAKATAQNAVVGGGTMVGHDVLERAGLGQEIASPEALKGYEQALLAGAEIAPVFGALHAYGAKGAATEKLRQAEEQHIANQPRAETPAEEAPTEEQQKLLGYTPTPPTPLQLEGIKTSEQKPNVLNMVDEHNRMLDKKAQLENQLLTVAPENYNELHKAYEGLNYRIANSEKAITEAGGVVHTPESFEKHAAGEIEKLDKKIASTTDKFNKARDPDVGDFTAAAKHAETLQDLKQQKQELIAKQEQQRLQVERQATGVGETLPLFSQKEAPPVVAQKPEEAMAVEQPTPEAPAKRDTRQRVLFSPQNIEATAERNTTVADQLAKTPVGETAPLFTERQAPTIKEPAGPPKPTEEMLAEKSNAAPHADTSQLDLFTPENFERTDERNLSPEERSKILQERLDEHLFNRLDLPGTKVTRAELNPVQVQKIMDDIEEVYKYVNVRRGMQGQSRFEEARDLLKRYEDLKARVDAGARGQTPNSMKAALKNYQAYVAEHITPNEKKMERLHKQLYKVEKVGTPKQEKQAERDRADREARRNIPAYEANEMSPEAATAKRVNEGDISKEAESDSRMRNYARLLGVLDPKYAAEKQKQKALVDAGKKAPDDAKAALNILAEELGKKNPRYEERLQEHIDKLNKAFGETVSELGYMKPKSLRTSQVTRDVSSAPNVMRTGAEKGTKAPKTFSEITVKKYAKEMRKIFNDKEAGTEYRPEGRTPLSDNNQEMLARKDLVGVLNDLATTSKSPLIRESAARLSKLVGDTKIQIVSELKLNGKSVPALYDPKTNTIKFHPDGLNEEDLIHEAEHAATVKNLRAPNAELTKDQINARNEIFSIFSRLKNDGILEGEYAAKDPEEFVSEVRSNQGLRDKLQGLNWFKGNMLERLFMAFKRLIGLEPKDVLEAADRHIKALESESGESAGAESASIFRSSKPDYGSNNPLASLSKKIIAPKPTLKEKYGRFSGLATEMEVADMRAGVRAALNIGAEGLKKPSIATQAMYHIIKADDKVQLAMTTLKIGPFEVYKDDKGFYGIRSTNKNSGVAVFNAISKIPEGNAQGKVDLATSYLIAHRANNKGLKKLDIGALGLEQKDLDAALAYADSRPKLKAALEEVREKYNAYNEGQINFLVQTGAIPKEVGAKLLAEKDFVPFYRADANGNAELVFNDAVTINVGNIKNQPYLHALKGGETKILPLDQSMLQNTLLLTDKATTNLAMKSTAYAFQEIGKARTGNAKNDMVIHTGSPPMNTKNVITFNQEPDPKNPKDNGKRWISIDTKGTLMEGVPDALIMKSLEGTALTLPSYLKLGGAASDLLRSGVTRTPLYIAHQLLRDPMAATFTGGVDKNPFMAVLSAGKHFVQMNLGSSKTGAKLIEAGIIQSNIFKGDKSDISKFALQLASGKDAGAIDRLVSTVDRWAMNADASTRALVYENAKKKGLSDVEADMMTVESMNYQKRGLSATVQHANRMIPFMNSQIQALNVLSKAARGNMPFEEQLNIKRKFYNNALLLAGTGLAYGMALSDNPYYQNAKMQDKYGNMFVFIPGVDEPIKLPVPYEVGYFFSLGVAAADSMRAEVKGTDQVKALASLFSNSIPGYSSAGVPQLVKPVAEVALNHDFYTGQPIESARLQALDPEKRYTANTTELAKQLSHLSGGVISPIMLEHLTRGYLGQLPLAAAAGAQELFAPETGKGITRASDLPLVGSAFQKQYGGEQTDEAYKLAADSEQAKATFNSMVKEGRREEAQEYMQENKDRIKMAAFSTKYKQAMAKLYADQRLIQSRTNLTPEEIRVRLDQLDQAKQQLSERYLTAARRE
jgi:hypothetical protein